MQLLWLLVRFRIEFKFFFKILYGLAPSYLSYLISRWRPSRYNLRNSKDNLLLSYPRFISKLTLGDRSFTCALQGSGMVCHSMSDAPSQSVDVFTVPLATPRVLPWQPTILCANYFGCLHESKRVLIQKGLLANPLKRNKQRKNEMR